MALGRLGRAGAASARAGSVLSVPGTVSGHRRLVTTRAAVPRPCLGLDHPDTLTSRGNLAGACLDDGRTAEAIALYERTVADQERILGPEHRGTLITRGNLAIAYQHGDRFAEAIRLYEPLLADCQRIPGRDNPTTETVWRNLANARSSPAPTFPKARHHWMRKRRSQS